MQDLFPDKKVIIQRVRRVQVVNGKREEHELVGKELEQWIKENVTKEEKNDNTSI